MANSSQRSNRWCDRRPYVGRRRHRRCLGLGWSRRSFISEVKGLMKPGLSAILVLTRRYDVILHAIRGLGGTVLKTNVDLERAKLIQSTLAGPSAQPGKSDAK
jgi:hypothetical protein